MVKRKLSFLALLFSSNLMSCFSSASRYTPISTTDNSVDNVTSDLITEEIQAVDYSNKTKYTVSFYTVVGTTELCCATRTVIEGSLVKPPEDFERSGSVFAGWYLEREYIHLFDFDDPIFSDTSIYAKWEGDFVFSELGNDTYSIVGYNGKASNTTLILPSSFSGKTVTTISQDAFASNKDIQSISIPNSITNIEQRAFYNCSNLTSILLPTNLKKIGSDAFAYCTSLSKIYYANTINNWSQIQMDESKLINRDGYIFKYCSSFKTLSSTPTTQVQFNDSLFNEYTQLNFLSNSEFTKINNYAYYYLKQLTSLSVSSTSFETFGKYCFGNCTNLESIIIDNQLSVKTLEGSFYNCTSLSNINGSAQIADIADYTFYNCKNISTFYFNTGITRINAYSFYNTGFTTLVFNIDFSLVLIAPYAFANCTKITDIGLYNITFIQSYAFYNCTGIKNVTFGVSVSEYNKRQTGYFSTLGNDSFFNARITYDTF